MLLSTRSSPLKLDLSLSSSFTEAGTPLPDYHSIKVASPLHRMTTSPPLCPSAFYLEDSSASPLPSLSPSSATAPDNTCLGF